MSIGPGNALEPATLSVPPGTTVVWHNASRRPVSVAFDPALAEERSALELPEGAQAWNSGRLYPGETWAHSFDEPGVYLYLSRPDGQGGTFGVVTVGTGGDAARQATILQPATQPPAEQPAAAEFEPEAQVEEMLERLRSIEDEMKERLEQAAPGGGE